MAEHILEVDDLSVEFHTVHGRVQAVRDISFHLDRGETLAILGESGSGKSVSASAVMNLIDCPPGEITSGRITYRGRDLLGMPREERRADQRPQDRHGVPGPAGASQPGLSGGLADRRGDAGARRSTPATARARAVELMQRVGIKDAAERAKAYPHQFSGGQRQRLMIAMALGWDPDILIADEPTTALDVTVQAQILRLLGKLRDETGMGLLMITHDLGVVAEMADRVLVMNAGEIVETGETRAVFKSPAHPYTRSCSPRSRAQGSIRTDAVGRRGADPRGRGTSSKYYGSLPCARRASASTCAPARPWASSASRARASRPPPAPSCASTTPTAAR